MKAIALLLGCLIAYQAAAAPLGVKGDRQTVPTYPVNIVVPERQNTPLAAGDTLIETGNRNLLINGEFEAAILAGPAILGWTSTGTAAPDLETSGPLFGKQSLRFDTSAQTVNIYQDYTPSNPVLVGTNAQIKFSARTTVAGTACVRHTGATLTGDSNCVTILGDDVKRDYVIPTKFGTGSTGVNFSFPSSTATILIDSVELGDRLDVSDVQQAYYFGGVSAVGAVGCQWERTANTFGNFAADAGCNAFTATGGVQAPATLIPGFIIPAGSPSGRYSIKPKLTMVRGVSTQLCWYRLSDGTNSGPQNIHGSTTSAESVITGFNEAWEYNYTTSGSNITIQVQAFSSDNTNFCAISGNSTDYRYGFDVYYYPPANKIFSTDSLGWFIDANIGGANPDLGVANVSTYTEITNAGLDLVVNTAKGSQSAKILCSGTNPPTGTTCAGAGIESVGISFVIPKSGQYEVCVTATHFAGSSAASSSSVTTTFQLVETTLNSQSIISQGGSKPLTAVASPVANTQQFMGFPIRTCGVFNFASVGEKAVRLMYEQVVVSPSQSAIIADRDTSFGQRDIHFTVKPAINLERINGSFAQIEDSLKTIPNHNYVINGNFDFWQRGTSLGAGTGARYLADRFFTSATGTTVAPSRQSFTLGQTDVPNNPTYFHRSVVSSSAGAANRAVLAQLTEDVTKLAGKTVTVSFWAKADATKSAAVEFQQNFGTGGSPSATVDSIGVKTFTLTTTWQKFTQTVAIPSVSGKTLGTNQNSSALNVVLWFDCGSSFAARCGSIGQQSGTFDIAQVKLEEGINATPFVLAGGTIEGELSACQRFYQRGFNIWSWAAAYSTTNISFRVPIPVEMRAAPVVSQISGTSLTNALEKIGIANYTPTTIGPFGSTSRGIAFDFGGSYTLYAPVALLSDIIQADAEL